MTAFSKQELQIIQAFSAVDVPEKIFRESNIKELIQDMLAGQGSIESDARHLERLRQKTKDGNFIGNWWNDRDDKVQDAQINLNKSIGRLTQKSSQLLIVNTAISKVLNDQQRILLEQQNTLKQQTDTLEEQNFKILEQQKLLEKQQQDINKANQGLMEAKGISQEQAQQLVGCVKLVQEAESRIGAANKALRSSMEQHLRDSAEQCLRRLSSSLAKQDQRHEAFEQQVIAETAKHKSALQEQMTSIIATLGQHREDLEQQLNTELSSQLQHIQNELACFASDSAEFKAGIGQQLQVHIQTVLDKVSLQEIVAQQQYEAVKVVERKLETAQNEYNEALKVADVQLTALQTELQKVANSNRLAIALVTTLALLSLGWQVAQHFVLM